VWLSITDESPAGTHDFSHRFPAVFDTGFNGNLAIREDQLQDWAGYGPADLSTISTTLVEGKAARIKAAEAWLHRDSGSTLPPFCLELHQGIIVMPLGVTRPRLPLLGMRAVGAAGWQVIIDGKSNRATITAPLSG
jgi:hypothetical protein